MTLGKAKLQNNWNIYIYVRRHVRNAILDFKTHGYILSAFARVVSLPAGDVCFTLRVDSHVWISNISPYMQKKQNGSANYRVTNENKHCIVVGGSIPDYKFWRFFTFTAVPNKHVHVINLFWALLDAIWVMVPQLEMPSSLQFGCQSQCRTSKG